MIETIADRYSVERAKWDAHAHTASGPIKPLPPEADFDWHCDRDHLMPGVREFLGDLRGRRVVEYGCGLGSLTVLLARSGAKVSAFDLSESSVEVARERARTMGLGDRVEFTVAPGEDLPYADASFDIAFGKAVLHHLEPVAGARELSRILRPGGRAAFSEPLGTNPLVAFARDHLPYPNKHERGADIPLRREDIAAWTRPFAAAQLRGVQLFSMVERGLGFGRRIEPLRYIDRELLERHPGLWPLCRYGVLTLTR
ncbi:MAG: class I SAM-dependent methyltransferase [Chloroflexota bacterium]|nr:class I SAM-dependent methyltransferase [Chloroflexota bacterium]